MAAAEELSLLVGVKRACQHLSIARSGMYRHRKRRLSPPPGKARRSSRRLKDEEKSAVLACLHEERFQDCSPAQVYASLLDEGRYHCSIRTMCRLLDAKGENRERRDQLIHPPYRKPELLAIAPNQLWSWDITKLRGPVKWSFYYLYVILDVFSRYVTGWMIACRETAGLAKQLIEHSCVQQNITPGATDSPCGSRLFDELQVPGPAIGRSGVIKTHSRPHLSDDNPFSEAHFKIMKYRTEYPDRFGSIQDARRFCQEFFPWYNHQHNYSGLTAVNPGHSPLRPSSPADLETANRSRCRLPAPSRTLRPPPSTTLFLARRCLD